MPNKLLFSGRAPSWKALAICILNNDHQLKKLGLERSSSIKGLELERQLKKLAAENRQINLF